MWKRKIQIKNVQNGLLGTLLNLLRLKIEKKREEERKKAVTCLAKKVSERFTPNNRTAQLSAESAGNEKQVEGKYWRWKRKR